MIEGEKKLETSSHGTVSELTHFSFTLYAGLQTRKNMTYCQKSGTA